jgi:hypothetical protein
MHGLKKAGMTRRANDGDSPYKLAAASGHKTLAMVQLYTKAFDRKKLLKGKSVTRLLLTRQPHYTNQVLSC